jgi:hypothetical protein
MATEGHKQLDLLRLLEESGFDSQALFGNNNAQEEGEEVQELESGQEVVSVAEAPASVTPSKNALVAILGPTVAGAVNFDHNIWYCSNQDITMPGGGGCSGASNRCCRAQNAVMEALNRHCPTLEHQAWTIHDIYTKGERLELVHV